MAQTATNPWFTNIPFLCIVAMGSLLAAAYTLFVVPYTALGLELTQDYDERTRVVRWRMYIGLLGSIAAGWLFRLAADKFWPDLGAGAFWVTVGVAAIVLVTGMIPVFGCREELAIEKQEPIRFLEAVRYHYGKPTISHPFRLLRHHHHLPVFGPKHLAFAFAALRVRRGCDPAGKFSGGFGYHGHGGFLCQHRPDRLDLHEIQQTHCHGDRTRVDHPGNSPHFLRHRPALALVDVRYLLHFLPRPAGLLADD